MEKFLDWLRMEVSVAPWSRLPAPLWFLIASPALRWAFGSGPWFQWPNGASRSPLRPSFWRVGAEDAR